MNAVKSFLVFALAVSAATLAYGATTLTWTAEDPGDLMAPGNYDTEAIDPVDADTIVIGEGSPSGKYYFSGTTTPLLKTVNFQKVSSPRSLDPGDGMIFRADTLNIRYGEDFSIPSGCYELSNQLGIGNSTSASDLTRLSVSGPNTFIRAGSKIMVGKGTGRNVTSGGSRAHLTISGGACVDGSLHLGTDAGSDSDVTVTGEGTHLYSTNGNGVVLGYFRWENAESGQTFYSRNNRLTVTNGAVLTASDIHLSTYYYTDLTSTGNVLTVAGGASVDVENLYVKGTNALVLSDGGQLHAANALIGYMSASPSGLEFSAGGGSYCEIGERCVLSATDNVRIGQGEVGGEANRYWSSGTKVRVLSGGRMDTKILSIGYDVPETKDSVLIIEEGGEVVTSNLLMYATNTLVVSGRLTVTNQINVGHVLKESGGIGGFNLIVDGGELNVGTETIRPTFYMGTYQKQSDGNSVVVTNGGVVKVNGNYVFVSTAGRGSSLVISGAGSQFIHDSNDFVIGAARLGGVDNGENSATVSDGGYLKTSVIKVGNEGNSVSPMHDITLLVDQGTVELTEDLRVGMHAETTNAQLIVRGSNSRITANSLAVGARSRVVFDLADLSSCAEALVTLAKKPTFEDGASVFITSSAPDAAGAESFDCTLLSCGEAMDFSNVEIQIDPASGLRRIGAADATRLSVRGGMPPGLSVIVK